MTDIIQKKPNAKQDFQIEEIDGEVLLYSPKATRSIYLNPSAAIIWQLCTGEHSTQDIIEALQEQFPDESDSIEKDVLATIEQFVQSDAITLS